MKKISDSAIKSTYIYIATTDQLRKRNVFKVGYADDIKRRMKGLAGYASFKNDRWYAVHVYEVIKNPGKNPDHEFHAWYERKHGICLMTDDEIRAVIGDGKISEKELYRGISTDSDVSIAELDSKVREFLGISKTGKTVRTSWCIPVSRTPRKIADMMVDKLTAVNPKFFDFSSNPNLKVCDLACKDASFVNAFVDAMFTYNNGMSKSKPDAKSLIVNILSEHIFAYCLDSERENIIARVKHHITSNPNIYGKMDGNKLSDKIFRNFTVEYMEEYSRETMDSKLDMLVNTRRKFDAVVMNPPYSTTGGANLHLEFTKAALEIADNVVSLFPFSFIYGKNKHYDPYKIAFDRRLITVEEIDSAVFSDTNMQNLGVYNFTKDNDSVITITDLSGSSKIAGSLCGLDSFKMNESEFVAAVRSVGSVDVALLRRDERGLPKSVKDNNMNLSIDDARKIKSQMIADNMSSKFNAGMICLVVSASNGKMNGKIITSSSGQICSDHDSLEDMLVTAPARDYRGLFVYSDKAAKNLKSACDRKLVRFLIYRMQRSQSITSDVVEIIPNIDWSNPKAKTDQGILELCGMAPDRARYWADYCADKIYQVDHGKRV